MKCIITCEHASNRVPPRFSHVFEGKETALSSHQAYDPGAAAIARRIARHTHAPVHLGSVTRLLIDLNRSPSNRKSLFSQFSKLLETKDRELLQKKYYQPYRQMIDDAVGDTIGKGVAILHISLHTFTPVKRGKTRKADIGLLYDPARKCEKDLCALLAGFLKKELTVLRVRKNYPYLGKADGFTAYLRKKYPAKFYAGIEIELNQALISSGNNKNRVEIAFMRGINTILKLQDFSQLRKIS